MEILTSGLIGSLIVVAYQIYRQREERRRYESDNLKYRRLRVISDLVAHRYVLAGHPIPEGIVQFNAALNRIPIEFLEYKNIIDLYHEIGTDFDAEKFHKLITALLDVTIDRPEYLNFNVLSLTPSVNLSRYRSP